MRRTKIGDVFSVKVSGGFRLYQYATVLSKCGQCLRIFDGIFERVPENIEEIVCGQHDYMIIFQSSTLYRIGLAEWLGNYPVPDGCAQQDYRIQFWFSQKGELFKIWIMDMRAYEVPCKRLLHFNVCSIDELPMEYRNVTLLNAIPSVPYMLYLLDCGFSLKEPVKMEPRFTLGQDYEEKLEKYVEIVTKAKASHGSKG